MRDIYITTTPDVPTLTVVNTTIITTEAFNCCYKTNAKGQYVIPCKSMSLQNEVNSFDPAPFCQKDHALIDSKGSCMQ